MYSSVRMGDVDAVKGRGELCREFRYVVLEVNGEYQMDEWRRIIEERTIFDIILKRKINEIGQILSIECLPYDSIERKIEGLMVDKIIITLV